MKRSLLGAFDKYRHSRYARLTVAFVVFLVGSGALAVILEVRTNDEFKSLLDGIWWSIITFSTTGYGDKVPITVAGRILAIVTIFLGIGATSFLSGALASLLVERNTRARRGLMDFRQMRGHLVICGWREDMQEILRDILRSSELRSEELILVSNVEPEKVQELQEDVDLRGLKFVRGDYFSELALDRANVRYARKVVIIADTLESSSVSEVDSKTVMAVITAKSLSKDVYVTAEILDRKYESYLKHVQCDEILFSRDFARQMIASSSATNGLSHIIRELLGDGDSGARIATIPVPSSFVNKTYGEYRKNLISRDCRLLLGPLVNTGSPNAMKIEALREAQKTSDVSKLVQNMQKVKDLEVNQPVLLPPDDFEIQRHSLAIMLDRGEKHE
ncbi:MAG: ion channel [Spirochaetota bacterium]